MSGQDNLGVAEAVAVRWVLLADGRKARLLRCSMTEWGRCRVEENGSIDNSRQGREPAGSGPLWKNATITFGIADSDDEDLRRFAREVVTWLERMMRELGIAKVHVLASGRFLGVLRKVRPARLARHRTLQRKANLMHLTAGKLAKHPVIRQLVGVRRSEGT